MWHLVTFYELFQQKKTTNIEKNYITMRLLIEKIENKAPLLRY